ncbi:MAG: hypothetical protein SNJ63_05140, partial [Sphingomonadaceae bacterium]
PIWLFWRGGDGGMIDRFGPDGVTGVVAQGAVLARKFQSGYLYFYALVMFAGLAFLMTWLAVRG